MPSERSRAPDHPALAAASERLHRRPGRPRSRPPAPSADPIALAAVRALAPRLVDVKGAAAYLGGLSVWTIFDLIQNGSVPRVRVPLPGGRELRRVLIDTQDLDRLIERSKDGRP
jgi:hypothetical protein